jgi:hypothetical protein
MRYSQLGWRPVPVAYGGKVPVDPATGRPLLDWAAAVTTTTSLDRFFCGQRANIGIVLGTASGGLTDIDLDCSEAVSLAASFLSNTATFGRSSAPNSHWIFLCADVRRRVQLRDPLRGERDERACIIELRGSGCQTVVPPSVHESGEAITWARPCSPVAAATWTDLQRRVHLIAAASLLARYLPRDPCVAAEALAAVGGAIVMGGLTACEARSLLEPVGRLVGSANNPQRALRQRPLQDAVRALTVAPAQAMVVLDHVGDWLELQWPARHRRATACAKPRRPCGGISSLRDRNQAMAVRRALTDPLRLVAALGLDRGARRQRGGVLIICPFHGDRRPSCSVTLGKDGTIRVKCFGCDAAGDALTLIARAQGLDLRRDFGDVLLVGRRLAGIPEGAAACRGQQQSLRARDAAVVDLEDLNDPRP